MKQFDIKRLIGATVGRRLYSLRPTERGLLQKSEGFMNGVAKIISFQEEDFKIFSTVQEDWRVCVRKGVS